MKLKRMAALLAVLMLLLSTLCAAEEVTAEPVPKAPLYVVLADCGWTLYGEETPGENSVVKTAGDPNGLVLSYIENVLPKLVEPDAQMMIYGYNDQLRSVKGVAPVSAADAAAVAAQVDALRTLPGRQSSLLNAALNTLSGEILAMTQQYDCTLIIVSGGAINYGSADSMNKAFGTEAPRTSVQTALNNLRAGGVKVCSYVWDLTGTDRLNMEHAMVEGLQLTKMDMGEADCQYIPAADIIDFAAAISDSMVIRFCGEDYGKPTGGYLKKLDLTTVKSGDKAVLLTADHKFKMYIGESIVADLLARRETAAEGDYIRLYSAGDPVVKMNQEKLNAVVGSLDQNGNGALDEVALVMNGGAVTLPVSGAEGVLFAAEPADVFTVSLSEGNLVLTAGKPGTAALIVTAGTESRRMNVTVSDFSMNWAQTTGTTLYVGEEALIAECADTANVMHGTVAINGAASEVTPAARVLYTPAEPGKMSVSLSIGDREAETREYVVQYHLDEGESVKNLTLQYPYFKAQDNQFVQVKNAAGECISLRDFEVSAASIANVYFNESGDGLFIQPKAAGAESVTLTDSESGQTITLNLSVKSIFSGAGFWLLAAAVPVCLIGLTVMIVLLAVKLGGKRR